MDIPTNYKGIKTDQPMEKQEQNKELQRADDIGGHNVSGTDSRREQNKEEVKTATEMMINDMQEEEYYRIKHTPSDTFIERKVKEWNNLGFNNIGNKAVSDKMIDFLKSSLQEQREQIRVEVEKEWREKIEKIHQGLTKNIEVNYHSSYNEGKIDLLEHLLK